MSVLVTFQFCWHFSCGYISVLVTFQFSDISLLGTFHSWWYFSYSDISFLWHLGFWDIIVLVIFRFWWNFSFSDIKFLPNLSPVIFQFWWNISFGDISVLVIFSFGDISDVSQICPWHVQDLLHSNLEGSEQQQKRWWGKLTFEQLWWRWLPTVHLLQHWRAF